MVRPIAGGIARAANNPQVATVDLITIRVDHKSIPVAKLMLGLTQLAGKRQLRVALLAIEDAGTAKGLEALSIHPEAHERGLERIREGARHAVVHIAKQRPLPATRKQVNLGLLELERHRGDGSMLALHLADVRDGGLDLEEERLRLHARMLKLLLEVEGDNVDAHVRRGTQRIEPIAIERAHQLVLAGIAVVEKVKEV